MTEVVLIAATAAFVGFHGAFCRWLLSGLRSLLPSKARLGDPPMVTVIVAARNEGATVGGLVDALLIQDYPAERLQIIIVDDRSEDGTGAVAAARGGDRVEVVRVDACPADWSPKKHALTRGLARARGEIIVSTDADTCPPPRWISTLLAHMGDDTAIVLGLVYHEPRPDVASWIRGFWALEFFSHNAMSAAALGGGFPINSNACNLAYRRRAWEQIGGFSSNNGIVSGDDDFLLQSIVSSSPWKARFAVEPECHMPTRAPGGIRDGWEQRKRWGSKCVRYTPGRVALLAVIFASCLWGLGLLAAAAVWPFLLLLALPLWATMWASTWLVLREAVRVFGHDPGLRWFPLLALLQIPIVVGAVVAGTFGRFRWKDGPTRAARTAA